MKKLSAIFFAIFILSKVSSAQNVMNAGGGSAVINGISHQWSVGEMVLVNTVQSGNLIVTQGFLQPERGAMSNPTEVSQWLAGHVKVYPNPTENIFYVEAELPMAGELFCKLYDMSGSLIESRKIAVGVQSGKIPFSISSLAAGLYSLNVTFISNSNTVSKSVYKIEKIN